MKTKKNNMSILLEVQRYKHYNLLQEAYIPREIEYAITEDKRYVIVENELFDINQNKSLGLYYESRLLKEEIITESWFERFESLADIGVSEISSKLAATGVGTGAAQAIDVLHGLSFIRRGVKRNDEVLKIMGYLSVTLALFPTLGSMMKNLLIKIAKKYIGKPIQELIKELIKNKHIQSMFKKLKSLISTLSSKVSQFGDWSSEYPWFNKIWSTIGTQFENGLKFFDGFIDNVLKPKDIKTQDLNIDKTNILIGNKTNSTGDNEYYTGGIKHKPNPQNNKSKMPKYLQKARKRNPGKNSI
jgi:hypothetical protein